jgi:hypothetical protein
MELKIKLIKKGFNCDWLIGDKEKNVDDFDDENNIIVNSQQILSNYNNNNNIPFSF